MLKPRLSKKAGARSYSSAYRYNVTSSVGEYAFMNPARDQIGLENSSLTHSDLNLQTQTCSDTKEVEKVRRNTTGSHGDAGITSTYDQEATTSTVVENEVNKDGNSRWHSFEKKRILCQNSTGSQSLSQITAAEMTHLESVALLRLENLLDTYIDTETTNTRKFHNIIRRLFSSEPKNSMTLSSVTQKYGLPLPPLIITIINHIKVFGINFVGIFRKCGKKANIVELEQILDCDPTCYDISKFSCYDLADVLKSYIRKLPEPLFPQQIASVLISLQSITQEKHLFVEQLAMLLLPDEHREALYVLLDCLFQVSRNSHANHMTVENLAICLAPAFFQIGNNVGRKDRRNAGGSCYDPRAPSCYSSIFTSGSTSTNSSSCSVDLINKGSIYHMAQTSFAHLLKNFQEIFIVPREILAVSRMSTLQRGVPMTLDTLGKSDFDSRENYSSHMNTILDEFYEEHKGKYKNWTSMGSVLGVPIFYRKIKDGYPLRLYRGVVELNATCSEVFTCYLYKGSLWQGNTQRFVIKILDPQTDLFYQRTEYSLDHFNRDFTLLRKWKRINDTHVFSATSIEITEDDLNGCCLQVSEHSKILGRRSCSRGTVLACRLAVDPYQNKTRVSMVLRIDLRGKRASYYKFITPNIVARELNSLKDYFQQSGTNNEAIV